MELCTGRLSESRALRAAADSAREGTAAVVLVQGPPGVGKTALVRQFLAGLSDFTVLDSAATPSAAPSDFDCLSRLLHRATVRVPRRSPAAEPDAPAAKRPAAVPSGPRALRELLDMSAAAPWVLFVDDAQWADSSSLKALLEAAREGGPLCLVLAARHSRGWDEEVLRALHTVAPLTHIGLAELAEAEAEALVATALGDLADDTLTRRLVLRSGGHPLYLRSLLDGHGTAQPGDRPRPALPASMVQRQLKGVPPEGVAALEALAVLGGSATVPTLSAVLGAPDCTSVLDPLAHEEFITRTDAHVPTVAIRHGVFRDALYAALPAARRRALHVAAVDAVGERQGLAHRVAATETVDVRLAAELLETASHELAEGGLLHAARTLLSSASLSPADDHRSDHLFYGAVRLLFWAGADAELARHGPAVVTRRPCPWRDEALGLAEFAAGRLTSARRLLDRAQESLRQAHPGQRAVVHTELALVHAILGQGDATRHHADQALRPAPPADEAHLYGPVGRRRGTDPAAARPASGGPADVRPPSGEVPDVCAQAPYVVVPPGLRQAARALAAYGTALRHGPGAGLDLLAGLPEDADRIGEEDLPPLTVRGILRLADAQLSSATTDLTMVTARRRPAAARLLGTSASVHLAMCQLLGGDWKRAAHEVGTALDDEQGRCFDAPALWSLRSVLDAFRGEDRAAEAALRQAQHLAQPLDFGGPQYHTAMARAMRARARGDHRGVVDALQMLAERSAHSERVRIVSMSWLPFLAESLVSCGLADLARAAMEELKSADAAPNPHLRVAEAWLHGRTAEAAGAHETALGRYTEAVALLGPGRDIPLVRGLLEISRGRASAALGRAAAATAYFDSAEDVFTRLGARPFLAECRAERRACVSERGDVPALDHLLTGREREVARLVGLGCTNREIADELTLSVKTIEYHLRSVFVKLGLRSRRELRRRVQEAGNGDGRR
ncbi:LuxR family transcriptional regulator [Streptomyces sp. NPDC046976]|uniref:helix-turn-helix transcriptional regulator n=1 Tax=Streptomyces sp. NPDC046976 TaxID=3155258 RepID=UPI003406951C